MASTARAHGRLPRAAAAVLAATVALGAPARGERRRVRLGIAPIYALAVVDRRDPSGGGVDLDLAFGVTDALSVRASGFVTFHAADGRAVPDTAGGPEMIGPPGTIGAFGAFAGLSYELNVLRLVPSFDLGLGVIGLRGDARFGTGAGAAALLPALDAVAIELGFGCDWLISRRWSVGWVIRYHALLTELERAPSFLYVGPRASVSLPF